MNTDMYKNEAVSSYVFLAAIPVFGDVASYKPQSYIIGGIIALFVMGYLVYSLIKPEKF